LAIPWQSTAPHTADPGALCARAQRSDQVECEPATSDGPVGSAYGSEGVAILEFIRQAKTLGLKLDEIRQIIVLQRARQPCSRVIDLLDRRLANAVIGRGHRDRIAGVAPLDVWYVAAVMRAAGTVADADYVAAGFVCAASRMRSMPPTIASSRFAVACWVHQHLGAARHLTVARCQGEC
jgi:hypothetical protein